MLIPAYRDLFSGLIPHGSEIFWSRCTSLWQITSALMEGHSNGEAAWLSAVLLLLSFSCLLPPVLHVEVSFGHIPRLESMDFLFQRSSFSPDFLFFVIISERLLSISEPCNLARQRSFPDENPWSSRHWAEHNRGQNKFKWWFHKLKWSSTFVSTSFSGQRPANYRSLPQDLNTQRGLIKSPERPIEGPPKRRPSAVLGGLRRRRRRRAEIPPQVPPARHVHEHPEPLLDRLQAKRPNSH